MKKFLLRLLFSKKEITIIQNSLSAMQCSCKTSLGESFKDTAEDIEKLKIIFPQPSKFLYDL